MIYYYIDHPDNCVIVSSRIFKNSTIFDLFQSDYDNLFLVQIKNIDIIEHLKTSNFYRVHHPKSFFNPT